MRKALMIIGVISIIASVLSLLFAGFSLYGFYNVMDGSQSLYDRLHRRAIIFFVIGGILALAGGICMRVRGRM